MINNNIREKMFKWFQGKNRKVFTGIIIAILVLALIIPVCVGCYNIVATFSEAVGKAFIL